MCHSARHCGIIDPESGGFFEIKQIGYADGYQGTTANGITTSAYGSYKVSEY